MTLLKVREIGYPQLKPCPVPTYLGMQVLMQDSSGTWGYFNKPQNLMKPYQLTFDICSQSQLVPYLAQKSHGRRQSMDRVTLAISQ